MAELEHIASGKRIPLASPAIVGRGAGLAIQSDNRLVSIAHAEFRWTGTAWVLRDLGSRNGTFVGNSRLEAGETVEIAIGNHLAFGDIADAYEVLDVSPPAACAVAEDGTIRAAEGGILVLPDDNSPELTVSEDGPGRWFVEDAGGARRAVANQAWLSSGGRSWRLDLPNVPETTLGAGEDTLFLGNIGLRFRVSMNGENIELAILHGSRVIALNPRAHFEVLLRLAQARNEDRQNSILDESEQGWLYVEDLLVELGTSEGPLNVSIFRARQQLALAGVQGATGIIERRAISRQLRLGVRHIEILSP